MTPILLRLAVIAVAVVFIAAYFWLVHLFCKWADHGRPPDLPIVAGVGSLIALVVIGVGSLLWHGADAFCTRYLDPQTKAEAGE